MIAEQKQKHQKQQLANESNGPKRKFEAPKCIAPIPAAKLESTTTDAA